MSRGLRYRYAEVTGAFREGGAREGLDTLAKRIGYDVRSLARTALAHVHAKDGQVVLPIQGSRMILRLDDPGLSRELIRYRIREREQTELIQQEIKPGMVGVDIGANLGYYALMEARLVGTEGRVLAIEPVSSNYEILVRNLVLNNYRQVTALQRAISDKSGSQEMWITPQSNWCNLMSLDDETLSDHFRERLESTDASMRVKVPTVALDDLLEEQNIQEVNFVRMDVEGFEMNVTQGMQRTLREATKVLKLFIEVHNTTFEDPLDTIGPWMDGLLDLGFRPKALAVPKHRQGILRDLPREGFAELLCSFRSSCPHVLLVKNE